PIWGAGVKYAEEAVERATGRGGRQLGGGTQQAAAVRQRVERGGDGRLVRGAGGGGQGRAADHVHAEGARALQQRDRQERRQVRVVDRGEVADDAAFGGQQLVLLAEHEGLARLGAEHQGAAVEGGGTGDAQQVGLVRRQQFGHEARTGFLHVVAVDGQGADRVARGDGAGHAGVAEGAAAAQGAIGTDVGGGAGDGAVHHGRAADHVERAAAEAAVDHQGA